MSGAIDVLPWTEKYRPRTLSDVVGQKEIVESLKSFVRERNMPHLLFAGPAGIGKTTATLALAHDLFGEDFHGSILELNASDERGINVMRSADQQKEKATSIKDFARTVALEKVPFKIIFLDEADALTPDAQHALRRTMELYAGATRFILSCNYSSKIIEPIQSRCSVFRFKPLTNDDVTHMVAKIAKHEGLRVEDKAVEALIYISEGDMRKAINALQGSAMHSKHITADIIYKTGSRARPAEIKEMIGLAMNGKFMESRKKLDELMITYGMSGEDVLIQLYREVLTLEVPEDRKVALIDRIGEYDFRMAEGANERIQLEALLAQLTLLLKK